MEIFAFATVRATRLLERLAFQVHAAVQSPGAEAVHDLRVAVVRFTHALDVFKPWVDPRERKKMRRRLKTIVSLAGDVRDCDIALETLTASRAKDAACLAGAVQARRQTCQKRLVAVLRHWVARKSVSKWRDALETYAAPAGPEQPRVEETAANVLRRRARRFFREGGRAASGVTGRELHRFRLTAKDFRYTLELFLELYGPMGGECLEKVKKVQTLLGSSNDCRMVRSLVRQLGGNCAIEASLRKKQHRRTRRFRRLWAEEFAAPGAATQWMRALRPPPRKPPASSASGPPRSKVLRA